MKKQQTVQKTKQARIQTFAEPSGVRSLVNKYVELAIEKQRETHTSWKDAQLEVISLSVEKRTFSTSIFGAVPGGVFEDDAVVVRLLDPLYDEEIEHIFRIRT